MMQLIGIVQKLEEADDDVQWLFAIDQEMEVQ
jgi:hypothetical protein